MDLTHAERLKSVVRWLTATLGKTQLEIAQLCGYENLSYFSQLINGKKPIAASLDEKVASLHPDLNVEYLRGNSDNMFLSGPGPEPEKKREKAQEGLLIPAELIQLLTDQSATIRSQQETIRIMVEKLGK